MTTTYLAANFKPAFASPRSVSVIICARSVERWDDIRRAVDSLSAQTLAAAEIILVADHDERVVERARESFPKVRVLRNDRQSGISGARNCGASAAHGEIVAFLDDDAAAGPTWLADMVRHYEEPAVLGVGGSAVADWSGGRPPRWMPAEFSWVVDGSHPEEPRQPTTVRNLSGNMSFRRQIFDLFGGFTDSEAGSEQNDAAQADLFLRISREIPGGRLIFDPAVNVRHRPARERRRLRYFVGRCYREGVIRAQVSKLAGAGEEAGPSYLRRSLPGGFLQALVQFATLRPVGALRAAAIVVGAVATLAGYLHGRAESDPDVPEPAVERPAAVLSDADTRRGSRLLKVLSLTLGTGVLMQGLAVTLSRRDEYGWGLILYYAAVLLPFIVGVLTLTSKALSPRARRAVVIATGVYPTIVLRLTNPLLLTGFDEQLHLRTLDDLLSGSQLFAYNPLLAASPSYPGLELLTVLVGRAFQLPTMVAVTLVVLACRLILVVAIYRLAITLTRDARSASLAVVFYAASPQFYFFNSQFAYQTLALSLAVGGVLLLRYAVTEPKQRGSRLIGALICFAAVVVTHHLTSWIAVAALTGWAVFAPKRQRRLIALVAGAAAVMVVAWAAPIADRLGAYLAPVFEDAYRQAAGVLGGSDQHVVFSDTAGNAAPGWERVLLVSYAVICTLTALAAGIGIIQRASRRRSALMLCLGLLCLAYPMVFAIRLAPKASEISDRATTFAFLPLAIGVALLLVKRGRHRYEGPPTMPTAMVLLVVSLSAVGYLGGLILGSGPDWSRLPGSYLAVADSRSLDAETLAAVEWSGENLPPGSTIAADRVPGALLAAEARLWVEGSPRPGAEPASLYFAERWTADQTATARRLQLHYLYVDRRLADSLPHQDYYFYAGETPEPVRLSPQALAKFAGTPGITMVYQHGPVAIYDLSGLGIQPQVIGWTGTWHQHPWRDGGVGLLLGLLVLWRASGLHRRLRALRRSFGGVGSASVLLSVGVLGTALTIGSGFEPGWAFFACAALPVLAGLLIRGGDRLRRRFDALLSLPWPSNSLVVTVCIALLLAAAGVLFALHAAWLINVVAVHDILAQVRGGS